MSHALWQPQGGGGGGNGCEGVATVAEPHVNA